MTDVTDGQHQEFNSGLFSEHAVQRDSTSEAEQFGELELSYEYYYHVEPNLDRDNEIVLSLPDGTELVALEKAKDGESELYPFSDFASELKVLKSKPRHLRLPRRILPQLSDSAEENNFLQFAEEQLSGTHQEHLQDVTKKLNEALAELSWQGGIYVVAECIKRDHPMYRSYVACQVDSFRFV